MARQTRAQRRARREAQEQNQAQNKNQQGVTQRARARQAQMRPGAQPVKSQAGAQRREKRSFVAESWSELKKVEWPNQKAVISGTAVVLIACVIVGAFLWLNDELWRYVVQHVLLR